MLTRMYVELDILKESVKEKVYDTLRRLREEKDGAAMVEYGLLIAGIAVAVMAVIFAVGTTLNTMYGKVNTQLSTAP